MNIKTIAEFLESNQNPEILFWIGCAGSYDDRYKKVTKAFVRILNKLNIDFAILGDEESCTGDPARRAGNEYLFQMQALNNIEILNKYKIEKIVTMCSYAQKENFRKQMSRCVEQELLADLRTWLAVMLVVATRFPRRARWTSLMIARGFF